MFKIFRLRIQREIEELKHLHRIQLAEYDAALDRREKEIVQKEKELAKEHEIKLKETVSLLKLDSEQKTKQLEIDNQRKVDALESSHRKEIAKEKESLLEEHYKKLSEAMAKLHEEGNVTTRFTQDLALKMLEGAPKHKVETRVLTGKAE